MIFLSIEEQLSVENPGFINPWLDGTGSFSDLIYIGKVFKYMKSIQKLIHDTGRIPKWKVLFDLLNHLRADYYDFEKSKNWPN